MQDWEVVERRREHRSKIAALALCVGVVVAALATVRWLEDGFDPFVGAGSLVGVAIFVAGLGGLIAWRPGEARRRLAQSGGYRDRVQREWVSRITILPAASLGLTFVAMMQADEWLTGEDRSWGGVALAGVAVINLVMIPVMVMGWDGGSRKQRRLLDDELTRAYRAEAMTWAFWVLLIGVTGLYLVGLWSPHVAVVALPMVMWVAAATAALKFSALHKRAERDDG